MPRLTNQVSTLPIAAMRERSPLDGLEPIGQNEAMRLFSAERARALVVLHVLGVLVVTSGACGDGSDDAASSALMQLPDAAALLVDLIDHTDWRAYDASLDPLSSHQPEPLRCSIAGHYVEHGALEVDTGECNYLLLEHPLLEEVAEGTTLELELRHFDLRAPEPASAHVALLATDTLLWETNIAIPGAANISRPSFRAPRKLMRGEALRFHLHNHGQNTWALVSVRARIECL
jgi:hypothetical protein